MRIVTVVGARPQFVKAAVVSRKIRIKHDEVLIHTGQHYDYNMSEQFFEELGIPTPDYNLGISGGLHGQMTGRMLERIESVLLNEQPEMVLVYGDTNSTLAAALAAAKLQIPICHIEAGLRFHNIKNPEEINRVCTDHISSLLLVCTKRAFEDMNKEGLSSKGVWVGDPMYDAFINYSNMTHSSDVVLVGIDGKRINVPQSYYYMTCHRAENTNDDEPLYEILSAMNQLDEKTVYPVHPRNRERVHRINARYNFSNIIFCEPIGYLESIALVGSAKKIVTDSGGVQREAFFAKKQCVTVIGFPMWPETMVDNRNQLSAPVASEILEKLSVSQVIDDSYNPFGDGEASSKIVIAMENYITDLR